jgi:queuosine precursor transporter
MWFLVGMYLAAIVAANLSVAAFGPAITIVNAFVFIALDLTSRDRLHAAWQGRGLLWKMAALIASGSALSYLLNAAAGPIAMASLIAFAVSAALDALTYHLLGRHGYMAKVNGSNVVSAAADSLIFPALAFGLPLLWWVMLGQFVAKVAGGAIWAWLLRPRHVEEIGHEV